MKATRKALTMWRRMWRLESDGDPPGYKVALAEVEAHEKASAERFTEDDVREAIRREMERYDATVTHPDAAEEVIARLREIRKEREQ